MIADIIIVLILVAALVPAAYHIYMAKKKGQACIGCPNGGQCEKCKHGL